MKKLLSVLSALILTCLIISPERSLASNVNERLVVGIQSTKTAEIYPLDPLERDIASVYNLVWEPLVTIDDSYMPQPYLCESWESSSNGKTWTFYLRKNINFSDGTPLTANDVVATAQYILDKANSEVADTCYYSILKWYVKSISAKDDYTVVVKANRNYYGVLYGMTFPVLPASQIEQANPAGTGPYKISDFTPYSTIWLEANEGWWKSPPRVKEIMFTCHNNQRDVMESYEYGRVDTIFTRSIAAAQYKSSQNSIALDYRTNQLETLMMNNYVSTLSNVSIRKAIRYAINVDKIAQSAYSGMVTRTDTPIIPGTWMYNDGLSQYFVHDPEKARQILYDEGWEDTDGDGYVDKTNEKGEQANLHLRIFVYEEPENDVRTEAANMIADDLAAVGISTTITTMSMETMEKRLLAGNYDLALVAYAEDVCPDPGFCIYPGNGTTYSKNKSAAIKQKMTDLRSSVTYEDFRKNLLEVQELFADECPFICLYFRSGAVLTRTMYTTVRDVREMSLLRGIEDFVP